MTVQELLKELAKNRESNGWSRSLPNDVLEEIGDIPVELTEKDEGHIRGFVKDHNSFMSDKPHWSLEGRHARAQAFMILLTFIQRKR